MNKITIPKYTLGEEIFNSITHGLGTILGIVVLVLTIVISSLNHNPLGVISSVIYGISMIIMFTISCIYHALSPRLKAKKVFRILDHSDIYIFIAGSYTPFCLSLMRNTTGLTIFIIVWTLALIGVFLNTMNLEKFKVFSFILYLLMGWIILFSFNSLNKVISRESLYLLFIGGVVYTLGAVLYLIGSKKKYYHSIFHMFIFAGALIQFFSILYTL